MQTKNIRATIESSTAAIAQMDRDTAHAAATERNLGDNIRYRATRKAIETIITQINELNIEEAAAAKRTFGEKYDASRKKVATMSSKVR